MNLKFFKMTRLRCYVSAESAAVHKADSFSRHCDTGQQLNTSTFLSTTNDWLGFFGTGILKS